MGRHPREWEVRRPARTGILLSERGHPEGPEDIKGNPPDRKYRSGFFYYIVSILKNRHEKHGGKKKYAPPRIMEVTGEKKRSDDLHVAFFESFARKNMDNTFEYHLGLR